MQQNGGKPDKLKALILERQNALRVSSGEMSEYLGICRQTYYALMNKHTDEWSLGMITKTCKRLQIALPELRQVITFH